MNRKIFKNKVLFLCISVFFIFSTVLQASPLIGSNLVLVPTFSSGQIFTPPLIAGIQIDDKNPFLFNFFVHPGDNNLEDQNLNQEAKRMIRYFLASLTIPEKDFWVNLSPYEKDRIIEEKFSETELGRDLLSQDYLLKQMVSMLMHPDGEIGKKFWKKIYKKAYEAFGTTEVSVNSLNKVWIVPEKATVYQQGNAAFVTEAKLKVLMEKDYLALREHGERSSSKDALRNNQENEKESFSSKIIQEIIIPEIEREVNFGKAFSPLRQAYHALILGDWFKKKLSKNIINHIYTNKGKTSGIDAYDQSETKRIYLEYVENYKKGICNYIKTEYDSTQKKYIPRKYFSGGIMCMNVDTKVVEDIKKVSSSGLKEIEKDAIKYRVILKQASSKIFVNKASDEFLPKDGSIFNNEYAVQGFIEGLPKENRAFHIENLKEWVVENADYYLTQRFSGLIRWDFFIEGLLPSFGFSDQQVFEIVERLEIEEKITEDVTPNNFEFFLKQARLLGSSTRPYVKILYKSLIAYLELHKEKIVKRDFQDIKMMKNVLQGEIINSFASQRGSEKLCLMARQMVKSAFFFSSSRMEKIDKLTRFIERSVFDRNIHKYQDLMDFPRLKRALKAKRNKDRKEDGSGRYSLEITKALDELITEIEKIIENPSAASEDLIKFWEEMNGQLIAGNIKKKEILTNSRKILEKLKEVEGFYANEEKVRVLLEMTGIRTSLYLNIVQAVQEAYRINQSDEKRYGSHIQESRDMGKVAYKMIEGDILLEEKIVEYSRSVFSDLRESIDPRNLTHENIQDTISAVYIIAKNMSYSLGSQPALGIFADNLIKLRDKEVYKEEDYYRIFGLIQQIQAELNDVIDNLTKEFKPRVELIQKKQGLKYWEDTPESLGFAQDLLLTTMLRQFNERFLLDCRKIIDQIEGPQELTMTVDLVSQKKVRKIANILVDWTKIPWVIGPKEATENLFKFIGSKVHGLYVMLKLGMPIPEWFVIRANPEKDIFDLKDIRSDLEIQIRKIEDKNGTRMGDPKNPLLFSLRSVFQISMPGEFSTVLNVGMNDEVFEGLKKSHSEEFALKTYINFLKTYGELMGPLMSDEAYNEFRPLNDRGDLNDLRKTFKQMKDILNFSKIKIPQDPWKQIEIITDFIMNHSITSDIRDFLACQGVPDSWKVSVIFQEMDFGYLKKDSFTAVVHTRDVITGKNNLHVEMIHGTTGISVVGDRDSHQKVYDRLPDDDEKIINHYKLMLEKMLGGPVELEITKGKTLNFLQARTAHLNPRAMLRSLDSLIREGILSEEEADFQRKLANTLLSTAQIFEGSKPLVLAGGFSEGVMAGMISLSFDKAKNMMKGGEDAILILEDTPARKDKSYKSYYGKRLGVVTAHGGSTQHFAVLARSPRNNMPYISMVDDLQVDLEKRRVKLGGKWFNEGDVITMDGYRGLIFEGNVVKSSSVDEKNVKNKSASSSVGGIDMTSLYMELNIKSDEAGLVLPIEFQDMDQIHFQGFVPVVLDAVPIGNPLSTLSVLN